MFERRLPFTARAANLLAIAACVATLAACNSTQLQGTPNVSNEAMIAHSNENWPSGSATYVYPLVMIVGPPGAVSCGLAQPHRSGVPWTGNVDANRTVTVGLPSTYDHQHYQTTVRYQCRVITAEHPEGETVVRDVPNIEFPLDPEARARRLQQQIELRARTCADPPRMMRPSWCNQEVRYSPERSFQPKIIHVGQPDAEAPARWARLRAEFQARCDEPQRQWLCIFYDNAAWDQMQRTDLGAAP